MNPAEIVVREVYGERSFHIFQLFEKAFVSPVNLRICMPLYCCRLTLRMPRHEHLAALSSEAATNFKIK